MTKTLLLICLLGGFASAQSNRTVLLMGADDDTIVRAFAEENACANLHEVRPENGVLFDWAIAVVGHNRRNEVMLMDAVNHRNAFMGTNFRKGVRNACYAIRGVSKVRWERQ